MSSFEINGIRNVTCAFRVVKYEKKYRNKMKRNKGIKKGIRHERK
jgi:hypothetical protein